MVENQQRITSFLQKIEQRDYVLRENMWTGHWVMEKKFVFLNIASNYSNLIPFCGQVFWKITEIDGKKCLEIIKNNVYASIYIY